jgi:chromosome segregation ATPase
MEDRMFDLEEPPPPRREKPAPARRSISASPMVSVGVTIVLLVIGGAVAALQIRTARRIATLETQLEATAQGLSEARNSLSLLWTTTTQLDATQAERADSLKLTLQDSIASVQEYAETEFSRFWQTAYLEHERRLDAAANGIRVNGVAIGNLVDESNRTLARIGELSSHDQAQGSLIADVGATVSTLGQTLATVDGQLDALDDAVTALDVQISTLTGEVNSSRSVQARLGSRVDGVEQWVDGFRSEGLSADAVQSRLAAMMEDLRRVRLRVDSLRTSREPRRGIGQNE